MRVLVIEDSPTQAEALRLVLDARGYEVDVARNGEEALARVAGTRYDLVISDIVMPGLSGYDACRRIKADPRLRDLPIVLLTTLSDPMDIIQGLECGADNFITKPYEPDYLLQRIDMLLENKRMRATGKLKVGVDILFMGKTYTITSDKEQILDLLVTTFEDIVRTNRELQSSKTELAEAKRQLEEYARRLEGEVRLSEEKYRRLMEGASDAIFILDAEGKYIEANRQGEALLGTPRKEILGTRYLEWVVPEERAASEALFRDLATQGHIHVADRHLVRKDGTQLPVEVSASLVTLDSERFVFAIVRDLTAQKEAEEALARTEEQFRQAQKMEAIGQLAGGVAHDFNNMLTAINGYSEILLSRLPKGEASRKEIEEIRKAGMRAAALTRQLLAFSRKQVLEPSVLDLNRVVSDIEPMLTRLLGEDIDLLCVVAPDLGRVKSDRGQMEQVILNLVVNARDAMPKGGRITIETSDATLDAAYAQAHHGVAAGAYVVLSVTDNGIGMDRETQTHIFEPFFTTKEKGKGTGLGLSTVYGIVKQSGGHISVYSEVGRGTTFRILLPRVEERETAIVPRGAVRPAGGGTETVLVAEDEALVRDLTCEILRMQGYTVIEAADGREALHLCSVHTGVIHLVITDIVMPEIGGRELFQRVQEVRKGVRFLFLSGYTGASLVQNGEMPAGSAFLQKPFTPDDLARKVREVIDAQRG